MKPFHARLQGADRVESERTIFYPPHRTALRRRASREPHYFSQPEFP